MALKAAIFATGLAGIVAEYVMATLASYLLGDAVLQWTLVISLMLFAMGLGSRLTQRVGEARLADAFVAVELALSVLVAAAAPLAYLLAGWIESVGWAIYLLAAAIGLLIGLELPLVTRLNRQHEEFRVNISSVIEKDYYGALAGGLFFAWIGLPILGLTWTPVILAVINLAVAIWVLGVFRAAVYHRRLLRIGCVVALVAVVGVGLLAEPIVRYGEQGKYRDLVVHAEQSRYQRLVLTRWKDDYWLYLDGHQQFATVDQHLYHEPLVHPAMRLAASRRRVLVVGGGDGLAAREILRHADVEEVTLIERDPAVTRLAREHPVLRELGGTALEDPRVRVVHGDAYAVLLDSAERYDVAIVDLPDPRDLQLARLYSRPFYALLARHLSPGGVLVTQSTSPHFSHRAFLTILKTARAAGLTAVPYHNHVPTMGEWSWVLGVKTGETQATGAGVDAEAVRQRLLTLDWSDLETRFLNRDALLSMLHFGKGAFNGYAEIPVSEETDPAVFREYRRSDWDLY